LSFIEHGENMNIKAMQIGKNIIVRLPGTSAGKVILIIDLESGGDWTQLTEDHVRELINSAAAEHKKFNEILTSGIFEGIQETT
jgi:hypothetical protein